MLKEQVRTAWEKNEVNAQLITDKGKVLRTQRIKTHPVPKEYVLSADDTPVEAVEAGHIVAAVRVVLLDGTVIRTISAAQGLPLITNGGDVLIKWWRVYDRHVILKDEKWLSS